MAAEAAVAAAVDPSHPSPGALKSRRVDGGGSVGGDDTTGTASAAAATAGAEGRSAAGAAAAATTTMRGPPLPTPTSAAIPRYLLRIQYDGTHFHGFQRQLTARTVQGCLEEAFAKFTGSKDTIRVTGSSRTDTG